MPRPKRMATSWLCQSSGKLLLLLVIACLHFILNNIPRMTPPLLWQAMDTCWIPFSKMFEHAIVVYIGLSVVFVLFQWKFKVKSCHLSWNCMTKSKDGRVKMVLLDYFFSEKVAPPKEMRIVNCLLFYKKVQQYRFSWMTRGIPATTLLQMLLITIPTCVHYMKAHECRAVACLH